MENLKSFSCIEGADKLETLLSTLTLHRRMLDEAPIKHLLGMLQSIREGDIVCAADRYHDMTAALLSCGARRVSGDLFLDYLLHSVLVVPSAFSKMAAGAEMDEPVYAAMCADLTVLGAASTLDTDTVKRWIDERIRNLRTKPKGTKDTISIMSSAAWSGGPVRVRPSGEQPHREEPAQQLPEAGFCDDWLPWRYGDFELRDTYVSDEALEEMYTRMLGQRNWRPMADDLWNFFASYGCGMFLKNRLFLFDGETIAPLEELPGIDEAAERLYPDQHARLMENTINFMRGERRENLLLYGGPGVGKTSAMLSLLHELPEVRMVVVTNTGGNILKNLIKPLSEQPLKFILLFDGIDPAGADMAALQKSLLAMRALPGNILLYATATESGGTLFPCRIQLPYPQLSDLTDLIRSVLEDAGDRVDPNAVRNACIDYQVEAKEPLSLSAAYAVLLRMRHTSGN